MTENIDRRRMLVGALGAGAIAGLGLLRAAPNAAAAAVTARACPDPVIPVVPGMSGDPRANQCWYQLDEVGYYHPSQEYIDALKAVGAAVGNPDVEVGMAELYVNTRKAGTYPASFISAVTPVRASLKVLADTEASVFDEYYGCDWPGLVSAVADFGQGILYDPRRPVGAKVHMMDGNPPPGYLAWHGFNRAFAFLGISPGYWKRLDPVVAFGWAVQSTAKPVSDAHNPPLPATVVKGLAQTWLRMPPRQIDEAFMSFPYPPGIS